MIEVIIRYSRQQGQESIKRTGVKKKPQRQAPEEKVGRRDPGKDYHTFLYLGFLHLLAETLLQLLLLAGREGVEVYLLLGLRLAERGVHGWSRKRNR